MFTTLLLGALFAASPAFAGETVEVGTPLGQTLQATKSTPADGTPEKAILDAIAVITAGQNDTFISKHCHPSLCPSDAAAIEALKNYNLGTWAKTGGACVHDSGSTVIVTRKDEEDDKVRVFLWCGDKRMPAPQTVMKVDGKWLVSSMSL